MLSARHLILLGLAAVVSGIAPAPGYAEPPPICTSEHITVLEVLKVVGCIIGTGSCESLLECDDQGDAGYAYGYTVGYQAGLAGALPSCDWQVQRWDGQGCVCKTSLGGNCYESSCCAEGSCYLKSGNYAQCLSLSSEAACATTKPSSWACTAWPVPEAEAPANVLELSVSGVSTHTIPDTIWGYNQDHSLELDLWHLRRLGGNRMSTFSWENGNSNAGADNNNNASINRISQQICGATSAQASHSGAALAACVSSAAGDAELAITLPIMGWVASGQQGDITTPPPSSAWQEVIAFKGTPFSENPDPNDGVLYLDEMVWWTKTNLGSGRIYLIGNEPSLWHITHPLAFGVNVVDPAQYVSRTIDAAKAVKSVDPDATVVIGEFTASGIFDLRNPGGSWKADPDCGSGGCAWFVDYILAKTKAASDDWCPNHACDSLIDAISLHPYPQVKGPCGNNLHQCNDGQLSPVRLQAPRTLYDDSFVETNHDGSTGWMVNAKTAGEPIMFLPRLKNSIAQHYPDLLISLGEFSYGNYGMIDGGLAHIDALGAFTAEPKVWASTHWKVGDGPYLAAAYRFYRDLDGNGLTFGQHSLPVEVPEASRSKVSVWASRGALDIHVVVINKQLEQDLELSIEIPNEGLEQFVWLIYQLSESSPQPEFVSPSTASFTDGRLALTVPALSAYHVVIGHED